LHARVYVSKVPEPPQNLELMPLLAAWRVHNERVGITGVLLLKDGDMMQYLEGPEPALLMLLAHIVADQRHCGIVELLREPIRQREFADWPMACLRAPSDCDVVTAPTHDAVRQLLDPQARRRSTGRALLGAFWHTEPAIKTR
jgi:hypothetical protein